MPGGWLSPSPSSVYTHKLIEPTPLAPNNTWLNDIFPSLFSMLFIVLLSFSAVHTVSFLSGESSEGQER